MLKNIKPPFKPAKESTKELKRAGDLGVDRRHGSHEESTKELKVWLDVLNIAVGSLLVESTKELKVTK